MLAGAAEKALMKKYELSFDAIILANHKRIFNKPL